MLDHGPFQLSRRSMLRAGALLAGASVVPLLQACSGSAATPTAAPTTAAAAKPTAAPASKAPAAGSIPLSIAVWVNGTRTWQKSVAQTWAKQNPSVKLTIVEIPYTSMAQKTLTELASNALQDVVFTTCKWLPYAASQGAFLQLDPLVKEHGKGKSSPLADFFPAAVTNGTLNGKLYGIPFEINTGNTNIIFYNQDLLQKAGAQIPTDTWTLDQFVETATKVTDTKNRVWGTDLYPGSYYDFDCWVRTNGGELLSKDGKAFQMVGSKPAVEAAQWLYNLRGTKHIAPSRQESQGNTIGFPSGQIALSAQGIYSIIGLKSSVGKKFKWDVVLAPVSPSGLRGYEIFSSMWAIYGKTKQAEEAYTLLDYMNSPSTQEQTLVSQGQPPSRVSVWKSKQAADISPIWGRVAKWLEDPKDHGPFPMPYNFKYSQLEDKWTNVGASLWYGQVAFESGLQQLQQACESVVTLSR